MLGAILTFPELGDRVGRPAHIKDKAVPTADTLECTVPVVYIAGTCMNAGKTVAATELVRGLYRSGLKVAAAKLTGVSLMRDALSMRDAGASAALTFNDIGIASTHAGVTVSSAKGILNRLAQGKPDVIVAELGDGILGEYGVQDILADPELSGAGAAWVMAAPDPVGCWGAKVLMEQRYGLAITVLTGPATDNEVGRDYVNAELNLPAFNARREPEALVEVVRASIAAWQAARPVGRARGGLTMRVAVIGAAGYAGGELLRLLLSHPDVTDWVATSRSQAGKPVGDVHPQLRSLTDRPFEALEPAEAARGCDVVFLALEHGESSKVAPALFAAGAGLVIDIAADFRVADPALYAKYYGAHPSPELLSRFRYGLADVEGTRLRGATAIAAPGCFATAAQLALYPLAGIAGIEPALFAVTGSSGAGVQPRPTTHHPARAHNLFAYSVMGHRHEAEVLSSWRRWTGRA